MTPGFLRYDPGGVDSVGSLLGESKPSRVSSGGIEPTTSRYRVRPLTYSGTGALWLVGWLVGWLVVWLVGLLMGLLVGWFVGWFA